MEHGLGKLGMLGVVLVLVLVLVGCKPYDFNADGAADVAFMDRQTGEHFRVGTAEPFWAPEVLDTGDYLPAPGAFEGQPIWHPGVVTTDGWESRNRGTFTELPELNDNRRALVADFTGDGSTERAIWDMTTTEWHIAGLEPVQFGQASAGPGCSGYSCECFELSDIPAVGDFDGDGITELAVFRPTDRRFHFLDGTSSAPFPMGLPAVADYDGDGTDDLAVLTTLEPTWHFEDGTSVLLTIEAHTVLPAPADYAGDGHDQPVAFDLRHGRWILGSDIVLAEDTRAAYQMATTATPVSLIDYLRVYFIEDVLAEGDYDDQFGHC